MPLSLPFRVNLQQHQTVGVPASIVPAFDLCYFNIIGLWSAFLENGACLRMNASYDDGLVHAFKRHTKEKQSSHFNVTWKIHKYFTQGCYLLRKVLVFLFILNWRRNGQRTSFLKIFDSIDNVSVLWRLDGTT